MSKLEFDRSASTITLLAGDGETIGLWDAANNVDSRSNGPWPDGTYNFNYYVPHPGDTAASAYGSHGIFIFTVPGREGMGVHSGRAGIPDGRGKSGFQHCTEGCIRTTDDATAQILKTHMIDPLVSVAVA